MILYKFRKKKVHIFNRFSIVFRFHDGKNDKWYSYANGQQTNEINESVVNSLSFSYNSEVLSLIQSWRNFVTSD